MTWNTNWKLIAVCIVALFTAASCTDHQKDENILASTEQHSNTDTNMASATTLLPSFSVQDAGGNVVNLQNLKGKKLFINLWASWCPPCKREMPSIEKLYLSLDTSKVQFLLVSLDDQFEMAKKYVSSQKLKLPIFYPAERLPALFQVQGIPATFIFNETGELVKRVDGGENYDTKEYRTLFQ
jgi:thiol-disulfide isomerase/thioredoxin